MKLQWIAQRQIGYPAGLWDRPEDHIHIHLADSIQNLLCTSSVSIGLQAKCNRGSKHEDVEPTLVSTACEPEALQHADCALARNATTNTQICIITGSEVTAVNHWNPQSSVINAAAGHNTPSYCFHHTVNISDRPHYTPICRKAGRATPRARQPDDINRNNKSIRIWWQGNITCQPKTSTPQRGLLTCTHELGEGLDGIRTRTTAEAKLSHTDCQISFVLGHL